MTRIRFQRSLDDLKEKLLVMAGLAEQAIQRAVEAYRTRDLSICDLVSRSELAINRLEREIDQSALDLLAMEQPMAIDLRFILAVIKINGDLERIGDQAANIAERAQVMKDTPEISLPIDIQEMGEKTGVMIRTAIQALLEADARMAETVLTMDDDVDDMNRAVQAELVEMMQQHPQFSVQALTAILISRNLERSGDHATNIAEDVIFWLRGSDVRHKMSLAEAD